MTTNTPKYGGLLTDIGAAALAAASAAGKKWQPTHMLIGDAGGAPGDTPDPLPSAAQKSLINQRHRAQLNRLFVSDKNANTLVAEVVLPVEVGGFWIREIGLQDVDGKFVAVSNCPPSYKAAMESGSARTQTIRVNIALSGLESVQLLIDNGIIYATQDWVKEKVAADFKGRKILAGNGLVGGGDLSADRSIGLAPSGVTAGSYRSVTVNANGVVTQGSNPTTLAGYAIGDAYTKADTDGKLAQKANKATTLAGYGITDALRVDGNAVSSSRLAAPRSLAASGDASWSVTFDGSANVSAPLSLSATGVAAGSYPKVTVDTKGRVTAGMALAAPDIPGLDASKLVSGVLAEQRLPVFARGLATAVSNSSDPNTATVPLMLTNHANGPVAGRYFYIQSMFYPDQNGNASQIATSYNATSEMYVRVSYAANPSIREWLPWQRCDIGGSFTKEADGELPGGVNLDSMVTSGWWSQSFTAQAASGANYPIVRAGLLHVYAASSNFIYQTYQAYDGESFYFRCRHSNTWFPWRRMWHGGDFNPSDYLLKSGFYWNALPGKPATFPPSAHNHDVGQLTSGILPLARGGVGSNTAAGARSTIGAGAPATASLGASGWWRDNDTGLIRQWGQVTCPADADASITFPIPFPTLCLGGYANQTSAFHPGTDASTGFRGATTTTAVIRNGYFAQAVLSWEAFGR
ncbi:phage tail protein [Pseudomonas aeruginosa]|uniref:phage tail protein n=1 Tax=Pseudomonas aeruginosa TaxID=287 RepID=UPI00071BD552|nr:phage tail protein [Pseudomonas aeruginosa]KSH25545.1 phage tail protein [Pseudomonas aeruginosa]MCD2750538.1 phage tail protein [Pseudomonas aeruginosa]MCO3302933.1 phage tail protein [Pseudomonas aeruginosa]MCV0071916.1 phage tail protein [Pseudomonas aeruginosa]MEC6862139.1 phage tail protein [Pseudomonas aeruginosa]